MSNLISFDDEKAEENPLGTVLYDYLINALISFSVAKSYSI